MSLIIHTDRVKRLLHYLIEGLAAIGSFGAYPQPTVLDHTDEESIASDWQAVQDDLRCALALTRSDAL